MRKPNTFILAIHDATQDLNQSKALRLATSPDVDPDGSRTVCVITKLDFMITAHQKQTRVKYLENRQIYLALGYFGLVNKSLEEEDEDMDIETARQFEEAVFNETPFSRLKSSLNNLASTR